VKLYFFPIAPNPTKVRLYLAEKAEGGTVIPVEQLAVNLRAGEQKSPEHLARTPFGKLPVLEFDDGRCIDESLAIIEYLEERYPEPPLIGKNAEDRARVRNLERTIDLGILIQIASSVHATKSPLGLAPNPPIAEHARAEFAAKLAWLEDLLADGRPFAAGELPTIADCTLAAGLQFGRFGQIVSLDELPNVARWDEAYRLRPSAKSVLVL
jgi:glutathione S-transferase